MGDALSVPFIVSWLFCVTIMIYHRNGNDNYIFCPSLCNLNCVKSLQKYFFKIHKYSSYLKKVHFSNIICLFNSSRFFENQHNEICSHLSEKASKDRFLKPEKIQNHSNEEKGKEKKKERREGKKEKKQKSKGCTLSFYNSYFGDSFWPKKKTVGCKRPIWRYRYQKSG